MRVLWRAARWLLLGIALLAALILSPFLLDQAGRMALTLARGDWRFLLPALLFVGAWLLAFGFLIRESGVAVGRILPFGRSALLATSLQFVYAFPAGAVAGLVYETRGVERMRVPRGTAMLIVGVETVVFYGTFFLFLLTGLVVLALSQSASRSLVIGSAAVMCAVAGLALASLYVLGNPGRAQKLHERIVARFGANRGLGRSLDEVALAVQRIRVSPGILAKPLVAALAHWAAILFVLELVFLAFGIFPHPAVLVSGFAIAFFVGRLTPIPGGLGAFEGTMTATFAALGIPFGEALTVTLAFRILTFLLPVVAGFAAHHLLVRFTAPDLDTVVPVPGSGAEEA